MVGGFETTLTLLLLTSHFCWQSFAQVDSLEHQDFVDSLTSELYGEGNDCSSALGVSMAFGLIYPGCTGNAVDDVRNTLGYPPGSNELLVWDETTKRLLEKYRGQCQGAFQESGECSTHAPTLKIANALWIDIGKRLHPNYQSIVGRHAKRIDFDSDQSPSIVNDWVAIQTDGSVETIVPSDEPLYPCQLLATNALYLKASWGCPFQKDKTTLDPFYTDSSRWVEMSETLFMNGVLDRPVSYSRDAIPGNVVVELPFAESEMSFIIALPTEDDSKPVKSSELIAVLDSLSPTRLALSMPKFEFEATYEDDLKDALRDLGIVAPFDEDGSLCGLFEDRDACELLFVDKILQKTHIDVNENGVEASAATAVKVSYRSALRSPTLVMIDHPFQFFIVDKGEGLVLFEGRLGEPTVSQAESEVQLLDSHSDTDFWTKNFGVQPVEPPGKRKATKGDTKKRSSRRKKVCINLGKGLGKHSFQVPYRKFRRIRGARNAAKGPCDPREVRRLRLRQKRERKFCLHLRRKRRDRIVEVLAPAAAREWLKRHGATEGGCGDSDAIDDEIHMKLIE